MQFIKKLSNRINSQRLIVSFCFLAVCIATQQIQTAAWNTGIIEFSRCLSGVLMPIILFTHYKWKDFVKYKLVYIGWSILGSVLCIAFVPFVISNSEEFLSAGIIVTALGIFLMGYCLIHTAIHFFLEKYRPRLFLPLFFIWALMMILMICSRSDYLWPECYFILFLCYYMTEQTSVQRENMIWGMVDGIILGFIFIQSHSLLFRPYDRVRYYGNFCNPNHNCMFLCMCLAAILAKMIYTIKENKNRPVRFFYFGLAGVCYSFIFMTICRSGYLTTFIVTLFFLAAYCRIRGKKVFFRTGLLLVAIFLIAFPLTYLAVRYIPTIHPHVLFYYQEGYSEQRVHSWDDRSSEKYVNFEELLQSIFGKLEKTSYSYEQFIGTNQQLQYDDGIKIASSADYLPAESFRYLANNVEDTERAFEDGQTETNQDKIPVLTSREANNAFLVRYVIYKWYFDHLSFRGSPYDEQGFQLLEKHWIQDTHNIYLDYGINFGWPVMLLFIVFIWWGIGRLTKKGWQKRDAQTYACLFIILVPPVFGLLEFSWGTGLISTVAFYFAFKEIVIAK